MAQDDAVREVLRALIEQSKAPFTADEIFKEFNTTSDKSHLVKLFEILSSKQPKRVQHLKEACKLLESHDPVFCLLTFLSNYTEADIMMEVYKKNLKSSTPINSKKPTDGITPNNVSEIKDRICQATSRNINRSTQDNIVNSSNVITAISNKGQSAIQPLIEFKTDLNWSLDVIQNISFQKNNIEAIPIASQETILIRDLIYVLTGVDSSYITQRENRKIDSRGIETFTIEYDISPQVHSSLQDIAKEILPLAKYYLCIQHYMECWSFSNAGQVLEALSEALRNLIHDYYLLLAQLEAELDAGKLTLHKMLFYIRPTLNTMDVLANVVKDIAKKNINGGQVLTLLFNKISALTGDEESQKFIIQLIQLAAVPFMEILQLWIQKGVINDPQNEFLVEDNEIARRKDVPECYSADYWEKRYTIRRECIPCFLEKVSDKIMRTGKYLNVIRQCGKKVTPPQNINLKFSPENQNHITVIQDAYRFASQNLLEVLLKENDLMGHILSVKRYLLLYQGDFIVQFMDACDEELAKSVDKVLPTKLESLLGLTLRLSSAKHDPYKDDVHCELLTYDLFSQMSKITKTDEDYWKSNKPLGLSGLECFAFKYDVEWPVSLVLNQLSIRKYQMLFRQLFYLKHVERQLCRIWKENSICRHFLPQAAELYRSAFTLRQRMMNAIQNLEYYMMIEVLEPNWHIFLQKMEKVENVDEVLFFHQDFLDSCLRNCMLSDETSLIYVLFPLCKVCLRFCDFIQKSQRFFSDAELKSMMCDSNDEGNSDSDNDFSSQKQAETSLAPTDTFAERVNTFDVEFTNLLIQLLKDINKIVSNKPSERFINLVHRMNFNSFYSDQMDQKITPTASN